MCLSPNSSEYHHEQNSGQSSLVVAQTLAVHCGQPHDQARLAAYKLELLLAQVSAVQLLPGAAALLHHLSHQGIPWAVVSNGPAAFIAGVLAHHCGIQPRTIIGCRPDLAPKPAPDPYLLGAIRLGMADPTLITVYEDSPLGIQAASRAGMRVIGITTSHPASRLEAAGAVACVSSLADISCSESSISFASPNESPLRAATRASLR
ncbi:MAG: HAD family hydrolase [Planctomycetota bacterium]|nr:MAG: HAD family hydrolase [Planctomycetota bacterium]